MSNRFLAELNEYGETPLSTTDKNGILPKIGYPFTYKSEITGSLVKGRIKDVDKYNITSTNNVRYRINEICVDISEHRNKKIKKILGK